MDIIKQALIELIADFLDNENIELEQYLAGVKDPKERTETDLHIKMAEAAFEVYRNSVVLVPVFNGRVDGYNISEMTDPLIDSDYPTTMGLNNGI